MYLTVKIGVWVNWVDEKKKKRNKHQTQQWYVACWCWR